MARGITSLAKQIAKPPVKKVFSRHEQICEEIRTGFNALVDLYLSKCGPNPTKRQVESAGKRAVARLLKDWNWDRKSISRAINRTERTLIKWGV